MLHLYQVLSSFIYILLEIGILHVNIYIFYDCPDTGDCEEGTIRLVDGIIEQEGRVEVCIDSVWGSVCDEGWDKTDAHVVCRQMGHPELGMYYISYINIY